MSTEPSAFLTILSRSLVEAPTRSTPRLKFLVSMLYTIADQKSFAGTSAGTFSL